MIENILIFLVAFLASALTMYSGFGLGTLLLPVYAFFFPLEVAVACTAIVHGANSLFKVIFVGKYAQREIVIKFGIPALSAAFVGAMSLNYIAHIGSIIQYSFAGYTVITTPIKLCIAMLMFIFALVEFLPRLRGVKFEKKYLFIGGILSGFLGGFSGHQGALRSAFLAKAGLEPQAFVGTNAAIGFIVDMVRIATYILSFQMIGTVFKENMQWSLPGIGMLAAFLGVILGKKYLHKVTIATIQNITGCCLLGIAIALGLGLI